MEVQHIGPSSKDNTMKLLNRVLHWMPDGVEQVFWNDVQDSMITVWSDAD